MDWHLIQQSTYYNLTTIYSGKKKEKIQSAKSMINLQPFITYYSSNEWTIIQNSAYPVYTYDIPPDSLMF